VLKRNKRLIYAYEEPE